MILLIDKRLQAVFGTRKTESRVINGEIEIEPSPIGINEDKKYLYSIVI